MGLESGNTIADLNAAWPLGTDPKSQGDDHLRLIKKILQADAWSKDADGAPGDFVLKTGDTMTGPMTVSRPDGSVSLGLNNAGAASFTRTAYSSVKLLSANVGLEVDGTGAGENHRLVRLRDLVGAVMFDLNATERIGRWTDTETMLTRAGGPYVLRLSPGTANALLVSATEGGALSHAIPLADITAPDTPSSIRSILTRTMGDGRYLRSDAGNSGVRIEADAPYLSFSETDTAANLRNWAVGISGGNFAIAPRASDGTVISGGGQFWIQRDANGVTDGRLVMGSGGNAAALPAADSIVTRASGDARYGQINTATGGAATDVPAGSTVLVFCDGRVYNRNALIDVKLSTANTMQYVDAASSAAGNDMAGTWRARGAVNTGGPAYTYLAERVG
jgi:hypothetical protein